VDTIKEYLVVLSQEKDTLSTLERISFGVGYVIFLYTIFMRNTTPTFHVSHV